MNIYKSFFKTTAAMAGAMLLCAGMASCGDDNDAPADRSYGIDGIDSASGDCIELFVGQAGKGYHKNQDGMQVSQAYTYTIRTKSHWMIVPKTEDSGWVQFLATEGDRDSKFFFAVYPNLGFDKRVADFSIVLDGVEQSRTFLHIEQEPNTPKLTLTTGNSYSIPDNGGSATITFSTNTGECDFEIEYENEADGQWLNFDQEHSKAASFVFSAEANGSADERKAFITIYSKLLPDIKVRASVVQASFTQMIFDDFSYLNLTSTTNIWDGTGERAIENWTGTAASSGWTGMLQGTRTSSYVYGRKGYVLTGGGGLPGAMASPAIAKLNDDTADLNITFDCVGYVAESGTRDYSDLYIGVWGPGEIVGTTEDLTVNFSQLGGNTTLKVKHVEVTNFPNLPAGIFPAGYDEWDSANARISVRVNGATAQTRILLIGGYWESIRRTNKFDSPDPVQNGVTYRRNNRNNRLGFDNFKVSRIIQ